MAEVENKNKSLFKDWVNQKILLHGDEDFKEALEKYNTNYLPSLLRQEWFKYLKVKSKKDEIKKISWLDRLNQSFKKNNITSIDSEVYMKIEFEEIIEKKEKEFKISKKKIIDDYENKIFVLKDISDKSISKFQEKQNKAIEKYQEKIDLLQNTYSILKKENNDKKKEFEDIISAKDNIIRSKNIEILNLKKEKENFDKNKKQLEEKEKSIIKKNNLLLDQFNQIKLRNNILLEKFNQVKIKNENYEKSLEKFDKLKLKLKNLKLELISEDQINEEELNEFEDQSFDEFEYISVIDSFIALYYEEINNKKNYESELDQLESKIDESKKLLAQYEEEITNNNEKIDDYESSIDHLTEKIVDYKEEIDASQIKLVESEKLKTIIEDSNNVIGDYQENLLELEKIKRDLSACNDELIKNKETIKRLLNENNDLKQRFNKNNYEDITTYEINEVNSKFFTNETRNPKINTETFTEKVSFKIDQSKLERQKSEQKKIEEKIKEVESIEFDDDEIEDHENLEENINLYNENQANESDNLTYKSYYQYLIKHIDENIDEDEEIDKETFSLFLNQYSIDEDEFIEEINTFCTERYDELLLEENNETFEISKEVFENFKLAFNYNDRD